MNTWTLRFLKVDGSDNDKPLAEQLSNFNNITVAVKRGMKPNEWIQVKTMVKLCQVLMDFQFHSLGTITKYRLKRFN